ncbi:MAG: RNase H [Lachnospiraceae bacterium]|nr:RNase H [Lachnospiraceae bacterium]
MAGKFYAVKIGKTPGIYNTWDDCKAQVDGYSGAVYKSFSSATDACAFLGWSTPDTSTSQTSDTKEAHTSITTASGEAVAYVDGSYNDATKQFSYGVVFFTDGKELHFSECMEDESLVSMRNVAGEIKGSEAAMRYALEYGCTSLTIYHDYEGISKWCLGEWKANKEGTIAYRDYYSSIKNKININFVKVKGHSNDKYNDLADSLAKKALGIE